MGNSREIGESWETYCQRKILEAQDSIRLYRGVNAITPFLRDLPNVKDIDLVLSVIMNCTYADARKVLVHWLHEHCGVDRMASILRAFDTHST